MKNFKPLAIAAAVSTVAAGYAGVVNAAAHVGVAASNTGSAAIVPYYTVQEGYITGINIVNTTEYTQVVKVRFRRGSDSMDALDFNVIMSPNDIFNGYISGDDENNIAFRTNDNSCTAPILPFEAGSTVTRIAPMPNQEALPGSITFEDGAMEGYIEIIGMAQADDAQPISVGALHDTGDNPETMDNDGMPANCDTVADNFFRNATLANPAGTAANRGVISSTVTHQRLNTDTKPYVSAENDPVGDGSVVTPNAYMATDANALSVSSSSVTPLQVWNSVAARFTWTVSPRCRCCPTSLALSMAPLIPGASTSRIWTVVRPRTRLVACMMAPCVLYWV